MCVYIRHSLEIGLIIIVVVIVIIIIIGIVIVIDNHLDNSLIDWTTNQPDN